MPSMSATTTSTAAKHNNHLTAKQPYDALPGGDDDQPLPAAQQMVVAPVSVALPESVPPVGAHVAMGSTSIRTAAKLPVPLLSSRQTVPVPVRFALANSRLPHEFVLKVLTLPVQLPLGESQPHAEQSRVSSKSA